MGEWKPEYIVFYNLKYGFKLITETYYLIFADYS